MAALKLTPQAAKAIEDLAATAFWRRVAREGYQATFGSIDTSEAEAMLISAYTADDVRTYMTQRGIPGTPIDVIEAAKVMMVKAQDEGRNLLGPIYADDIKTCRTPSVTDAMLEERVQAPTKIIGGGMLAAHGTLVVRPPFPAFVVGTSKAPAGVFIVKETARALGRQVFMLMQRQRTTPMSSGAILTEGMLLIPAPDEAHGDLWERLVPNSTRSVASMRAVTSDGLNEISFTW
ncbi:hypothetical protein [Paucibacter soli]|uniref:hypothetical protein n=1 Tax=Paucibacter soli TaxID=3133433 RepID=UPI0030A7D729